MRQESALPIDIPDVPLHRFLEERAQTHPDYIAVTVDDRNLTYAELDRSSRAFASGLRALGVDRGDRVGLVLPNLPQYVIAFFGILRAGGVVVNLSVMTPGEALRGSLRHAGADVVVTADVFATPLLEAADEGGLETVVMVSLTGRPLPQGTGKHAPKGLPFEALFENPSPDSLPADLAAADTAVLQVTSGTTGRPKAAVLTHGNLAANVVQVDRAVPVAVPENGGIVCVIPFFHVFGLTVCLLLSVYKGYRMILVPRFDWSSVLSLLEIVKTFRPVSLPAVSSLWAALVSHPEAGDSSLDTVLVPSGGGSPLPAWVQERFHALTGRNIMEAYGLSEASSTTHMNLPDRVVPGSIGVPVPGTEARIVDLETGETPCGAGEVGELIVRGPQVMQGYWQEPELTARALRNGWLYTGDLARQDENGSFFIVDRKDDLIISSGFNIYPSEIEDALLRHDGVEAAAAVGTEDRIRGQVVKAFVKPKAGAEPTREALLDHCRALLAEYEVPKSVVFVEEIPQAPTGKPLRRMLREGR